MSRTTRHICRTLDQVASNSEDATIAIMRAAENLTDQVLKQQLFNIIHQMNVDANQLRFTREEIAGHSQKRA